MGSIVRTTLHAFLFLTAALCLSARPTPSQSDAERKLAAEAARKLNAFATYALKVGYPRRAREVYREVLDEYDPDNEVARRALGYVRVGTSWAEDPDFEFPAADRPDPAIHKLLERRWRSVAQALGKAHRELAGTLLAAGDSERAQRHFRRALRFLPGDAAAARQLGLKHFAGFYGSDVETTLLKRSRMMDREIERQRKKTYRVEPAATTHPLLDKAGVSYRGVASEHFFVWGTFEEEVLQEAARYAERALAFCKAAFAGVEGYPPRTLVRHMAFFKKRADWEKVLQANAGLLGEETLEFVLKHTSATTLGAGEHRVAVAGTQHVPNVYDLSVRWVAHGFSRLRSDALVEGIGHAVVGMFFGRNLISLVGQAGRGSGTVAGKRRQRKLLLPDLSSWEEAAYQIAWKRAGAPAAKLPLIRAVAFSDDDRIKAWSFCDYLLRRDPGLLRALDRSRTATANTAPRIAERFFELTKVRIEKLEEEWRHFWKDDTPLLRAIKGKANPLETFGKATTAWLEAFNAERKRHRRGEVGWSINFSEECKAHVTYLARHRSERGPVREHTQRLGLPGATRRGAAFARSALVSVGQRDPRKAIRLWMNWPGYRDAVLDGGLDTVGLHVEKDIAVMDVTRGVIAGRGVATCYPNGYNNKDFPVPSQVSVAELGPDVAELLARHGRKNTKTIGYPMSLHFYGGMPQNPSVIECQLTLHGKKVPGVLHIATTGRSRRSSAPGLVVFYPFEPLRRGSEYHVSWFWGSGRFKVRFVTQ